MTDIKKLRYTDDGGLVLPERTIPVPPTISAEARRFLATPQKADDWPPLEDRVAIKAAIAERERRLLAAAGDRFSAFPARVTAQPLNRSTLYHVTPDEIGDRQRHRAIYYIHGGAYIIMGGAIAGELARPIAVTARCRAFSIDYRLAPDHPFPAALDDAIDGYRAILAHYEAKNIGVVGSSAGGGLAAAMLLKARDLGLPLPGAAVLHTPEVAMTESGATFETNWGIDVVLKRRLTPSIALYANGHDLKDPYLSPIFGDFTRGFPPTLLASGTRDLFLSNTAIMHRALRRAGIDAELHVFEGMPHGGFMGAPEDWELLAEEARFLDRHLGTAVHRGERLG